MARRKRYVRGDRAFRRLIKKMADQTIRDEMLATLDMGGDAILAAQQADATVSRRVRSALSKRLLRGSMRLRVGLVGRPVNRRLWWSRIIERGRKAQTVVAVRQSASKAYAAVPRGGMGRRGHALARGIRGVYALRVTALAPKPAIQSARVRAIRDTMGGQLRTYWDRVLAKAAQGVSDA